MLPWAYRSYTNTGEWRFSATNGGMVLYISLGQLSNNPWNVSPLDKTAIDFAKTRGFNYPFSPAADRVLQEEFVKQVKRYPGAYIKKVGFNLLKSITGGVYTGEYSNLFINADKRIIIDDSISRLNGAMKKINFIASLPYYNSIPMLIEKIIQGIYIPIFLISIITFFIFCFLKGNKELYLLKGILLSIILYKILTISLIQYEYRHMNSIYIFIIGISIIYFNQYIFKKNNRIL
jgi:hypothetical protein